MRFLPSALVLALAMLWVAVAHAEDSPERRQQRAQAFWEEGASMYDAGRFEDAVKTFEQAYAIWPFPEILFNLCQGNRQLKRYERAIFFCKSFLRNRRDAANRAEVSDLVTDMQKILDAQNANEDIPPAGVQRPAMRALHPVRRSRNRRAWYSDRWGWVATGAGAMVAGIGVGIYLSADGLRGDAGQAGTESERSALLDEAGTREILGATGMVVGAVFVVAGVALFGWNPEPAQPAGTSVGVGPGWIGLQGSF